MERSLSNHGLTIQLSLNTLVIHLYMSLVHPSLCQPCSECLSTRLLFWCKLIETMKVYGLYFPKMKMDQAIEIFILLCSALSSWVHYSLYPWTLEMLSCILNWALITSYNPSPHSSSCWILEWCYFKCINIMSLNSKHDINGCILDSH